MMPKILRIVIAAAALTATMAARADYSVEIEGSVMANTSSGEFAPFYINSMRHGRITAAHNALAEVSARRPMSTATRFSYGFCVDALAGWSSANDYGLCLPGGEWTSRSARPPAIWLQQLYGEVKYRGVFLTVGMKEHTSALLNARLGSGDLVESGNSRPVPEVRVGFIDFQNIPFTNGWVQIQGEIGYGRTTDGDWWLDRYNRFNYHVNTGEWINYKRCYFRTKPSQPLSVTVGMQAAATFGGTRYAYNDGELTKLDHYKVTLKSLWNAFFPMEGSGEDFYEGNHLGSWDFLARYRLPGGDELKAYFQWPWEDGSGIGRRNGWDGLWGLEWQSANTSGIVSGAVVEYIDMTNQSGPQHFAPGDFPGNTIVSESTGGDDYYNNYFYNSYATYGMSIGSPMLMAPVFNLNGHLAYVATRMRGFHIAAEGRVTPSVAWRVKGGYRVGYGNGRIMLPRNITDTSVALAVDWNVAGIEGMTLGGTVALDHGDMPGNSVGALVKLTYSGNLNFPLKR